MATRIKRQSAPVSPSDNGDHRVPMALIDNEVSVEAPSVDLSAAKQALDDEGGWRGKCIALRQIEQQLAAHARLASKDARELVKFMESMAAICQTLRDARSENPSAARVKRLSCSVVSALARATGESFSAAAGLIIPELLPFLRTPKQEVQEAVTRSVKTVLEECPSLRTLRAATESAGDSPYPYLRRKASTFLRVAIERWPRDVQRASLMAMLEQIPKTLLDVDANVRREGRHTFGAFVRRWPAEGGGIYRTLDRTSQRATLQEHPYVSNFIHRKAAKWGTSSDQSDSATAALGTPDRSPDAAVATATSVLAMTGRGDGQLTADMTNSPPLSAISDGQGASSSCCRSNEHDTEEGRHSGFHVHEEELPTRELSAGETSLRRESSIDAASTASRCASHAKPPSLPQRETTKPESLPRCVDARQALHILSSYPSAGRNGDGGNHSPMEISSSRNHENTRETINSTPMRSRPSATGSTEGVSSLERRRVRFSTEVGEGCSRSEANLALSLGSPSNDPPHAAAHPAPTTAEAMFGSTMDANKPTQDVPHADRRRFLPALLPMVAVAASFVAVLSGHDVGLETAGPQRLPICRVPLWWKAEYPPTADPKSILRDWCGYDAVSSPKSAIGGGAVVALELDVASPATETLEIREGPRFPEVVSTDQANEAVAGSAGARGDIVRDHTTTEASKVWCVRPSGDSPMINVVIETPTVQGSETTEALIPARAGGDAPTVGGIVIESSQKAPKSRGTAAHHGQDHGP